MKDSLSMLGILRIVKDQEALFPIDKKDRPSIASMQIAKLALGFPKTRPFPQQQ